MPLNQSQALSLATTLSLLEERCDQIEQLLATAPTQGVLHQTVRDIPSDTYPALFAYLTQLRAEIARLAAAYHLDAARHSATRILVALLATSWQDLEDVRPAKLGRYGPLDPALQELGMRAAFSSKADFSGIADPANGEPLQITRVVQRTFVAVDENGTEAAAATGVGMTAMSAFLGPTADFKADHPFLFFVYDASHGRILFAGRVTSPPPPRS
jgi:hypothetical protein